MLQLRRLWEAGGENAMMLSLGNFLVIGSPRGDKNWRAGLWGHRRRASGTLPRVSAAVGAKTKAQSDHPA